MKEEFKSVFSWSCMSYLEAWLMIWQLCVQYANGTEHVLRSYETREAALRSIDLLYSQGYPLHIAYVVRHATVTSSEGTEGMEGREAANRKFGGGFWSYIRFS
jgi:hypothetical protein